MSTTNPLVDFLASYGPQPSSNNLYDEFVVETQEKTGCSPIRIAQPLIRKLADLLLSDKPCSVILTGTAGDGKTYTARKIVEELSDSGQKWNSTDKIFTLTPRSHPDRHIRFIKDLSELNANDKKNIFPDIYESLWGRSTGEYFVICVNDGHLLKFFRDYEPDDKPMHGQVANMMHKHESESTLGRFYLINMSLGFHHETVESIIDAIAHHPNWPDCNGCHVLHSDETPCPIRVNRKILCQDDSNSMRARLQDMIRIAAANGNHLSIRQLILLTVNILMGDQKPGAALLTCRKAQKRARDKDYRLTNPYANAFGENLTAEERSQYGAFAILDDFRVGRETNNYFDQSLLHDAESLGTHPIYASQIFDPVKKTYDSDPGQYKQEFRMAMINQRRRLFFSVGTDSQDRRTDPWNLSVFKYGSSYIELVEKLGERSPIPDKIRRNIICGLNRMITGEMTITDDQIWLTEPSSVYLGHGIPLLADQAGSKRQGGTYITFHPNKNKSHDSVITKDVPVLRITTLGQPDSPVDLELSPILLECLLRVSDGALPVSFSSQCHQSIHRFQLHATANSNSSLSQQIEMRDGYLEKQPIELLMTEDEWQ